MIAFDVTKKTVLKKKMEVYQRDDSSNGEKNHQKEVSKLHWDSEIPKDYETQKKLMDDTSKIEQGRVCRNSQFNKKLGKIEKRT